MCVCDGGKGKEKEKWQSQRGTFRARKPTATFMTARSASGVSYVKKQSFAENNIKQIVYCGCDFCMGVKNEKGYEL